MSYAIFMSTLYIVATPIGNLEDITLRAIKTLESVDIVACEDTRHTQLLLNHLNIHKRTIACHSYNEEESAKGIIELLDSGADIAYCSDAGTPGVSDPGARLVERVRKESDHKIVPIPGASASVTLISAAGKVGKTFTFEGFLSPKKGRRTKRLEELIARKECFIIYESPFRVLKTLEEIKAIDSSLKVVFGRELTKAFEEIFSGTVEKAIETLKARSAIKGEFAIAIVPGDDDDKREEASDSEE